MSRPSDRRAAQGVQAQFPVADWVAVAAVVAARVDMASMVPCIKIAHRPRIILGRQAVTVGAGASSLPSTLMGRVVGISSNQEGRAVQGTAVSPVPVELQERLALRQTAVLAG
jgi:hypothetical protein